MGTLAAPTPVPTLAFRSLVQTMPTVTSNGVEVPFDAEHFAPLVDSTAWLGTPAALGDQYRRHGYLYLRRVIDPERLRRLRAGYFGAFEPSYLDHHRPVEAGVFSGRRPHSLPAHGTVGHPAHGFVRSEAFAELAGDPALAELAEGILDAPCRLLPRQIVAISTAPRRGRREPTGTTDTWTRVPTGCSPCGSP